MFLSLESDKCVFCICSLLRIYWRVSRLRSLRLLYMFLVRRLVMAGTYSLLNLYGLSNLRSLHSYLSYSLICIMLFFSVSLQYLIISLWFEFCRILEHYICYNFVTMLQSIEQIGNRADRMSITSSKLYLYSGTDIEVICSSGNTCAYSKIYFYFLDHRPIFM